MRAQIREHGTAIIDNLLAIALGRATRTAYTMQGDPYEVPPSFKDQASAAHILVEYWLGKATQAVELSFGDDSADAVRLTLERLRREPASAAAILTLAEASAKGGE